MVRPALFLAVLLASTAPAAALFVERGGIAMAAPDATNSTITGIAIFCGDPVAFEVTSDGGPVLPAGQPEAEVHYFYTPGKVLAAINDMEVPMMAAGSGEAVVLFSEDPAAPGGMGPVTRDFVAMLSQGSELVLHFDITAADDPDTGTVYETFARFGLEGAADVLETVLADCRG